MEKALGENKARKTVLAPHSGLCSKGEQVEAGLIQDLQSGQGKRDGQRAGRRHVGLPVSGPINLFHARFQKSLSSSLHSSLV